MDIRFLKEWKDYKIDDVENIADSIAKELIEFGFAENVTLELHPRADTYNSPGLIVARKKTLEIRRNNLLKQLEIVDQEIAKFEKLHGGPVGKDLKGPPKDKQIKSAPVSKTVEQSAV